MKKNNKNKGSLISARIHRDFFFNERLKLPTVVKEYEQIEKILNDLQYLACVSVRIEQLNKVERLYGSVAYNAMLTHITKLLVTLKEQEFRSNDIIVVDTHDMDTFIIFLSSPREDRTKLLYHMEHIAQRIRARIEDEVFNLLYPYLKEYVRPVVGYALEIQNPMISNMRLIMQLAKNSRIMGDFLATKRENLSKYELQKIIIEGKVKTVFQPIVDLSTLEVIGYEALSRGPKNTEFYNPHLMFLIASETGLSFELDRLCRATSLESARHLKTDKKIFVNTLSMTIHDPEFRGTYLKDLLRDLKLKPENVVFEVSEKLAIDNYDLFRTSLKDYADLGIIHAGDDIGTGYSDLERIMELHPGYLKIDISFAKEIHNSLIKQEIVKAIVSLARNIKSQVIVEGIETPHEYKTLRDLGVRFGQGFLFAKPSTRLMEIHRNF